MSAGEQDLDIISEQLMAGLDEAIDAFIKAVKLKGILHTLIEQRLDGVLAEVISTSTHARNSTMAT